MTDPRPARADRTVLFVVHVGRERALEVAADMHNRLARRGIECCLLAEEAPVLSPRLTSDPRLVHSPADLPQSCDMVIVVGGDGTILRAAEWAHATDAPLLGVNLGHVGFLAELEAEDVDDLVAAVTDRTYTVEDRTTLDVEVLGEGLEWKTWALNEVSVEKVARERMLEVVLEIDGRPLSRWGCDGVICATPTGSTAYAWSAGGPVVWPDVQALIVVPLSAHALFARPLVTAPSSCIAVELPWHGSPAVIWCDGQRSLEVPPGTRIQVTAASQPLRFARVQTKPFTDRLVRKFDLPVEGWRGDPHES